MKIVFLDSATMGDTPLSPISALGDLKCYPRSSAAEARERVGECEVLIVNKVKVDRALLDAAPKLRLVCEAATGVNNIDTALCASRGIAVRNVAAYSTESVVQTTFMHILSLLGCAPYLDVTDVSQRIVEADGKTVGIVGMGTIGRRVAAVAEAFGMNVIYYSTSGTNHCTDFPAVTLDELLELSDVVSVHAPLNERTAGLIGAAELRKMKPTAFVVNLGRGGIVDEKALADAVDGGVIAGAALDVFTEEPLPADSPLLRVKHPERFRFSPHTAWASDEARRRLVAGIAANISAFIGK